jgi:hypothetical protein
VLGLKGVMSSSQTGTPFARSLVQPIDGQSSPEFSRGLSRMCLYDLIMLKGTLPSNEYTKLPLLCGLMLHRPTRSRIGLAVAFAIFRRTLCTMASATRVRSWASNWVSRWPPVLRTVTSVMVGVGLSLFFCGRGCVRLEAAAAAPA